MSFFKTILKIIAIVLIIIAIIYLIAAVIASLAVSGTASGLGVLMLGATTLTATQLVWLALGALVLAAIADPKTTSKVISKVADGVGTVVTSLGSAAGSLIGAGLKGLLSNPIVLGVGAVLLYLMLKGDGNDSKRNDYRITGSQPRYQERDAVFFA